MPRFRKLGKLIVTLSGSRWEKRYRYSTKISRSGQVAKWRSIAVNQATRSVFIYSNLLVAIDLWKTKGSRMPHGKRNITEVLGEIFPVLPGSFPVIYP